VNAVPEPLTPPECDLRGMPYMPLDVVRMFDSDFYALSSGDEFKAGLSLWCKAFLQVPAGSLPDDDRLLAHLSGSGARWRHLKDMALRGWIKCSDGRLYHHTVAEKVLEAWKARLDRRARTEAARAAKQASRVGSGNDTPPTATEVVATSVIDNVTQLPTKVVATSVTDLVTGSKGTEGKGTEGKTRKKEAPHSPPPGGECDGEFETFWRAYPRKVSKGGAKRAWVGALRKTDSGTILAAISRARFSLDPRFIPHPATWLNQERWLDEPASTIDPVLAAVGLKPEDLATHPEPELLQ
jgi:hypothetical protein